MCLFQLQFVSSEIQSIFARVWEQLWLQICPFTFLPGVLVVCDACVSTVGGKVKSNVWLKIAPRPHLKGVMVSCVLSSQSY